MNIIKDERQKSKEQRRTWTRIFKFTGSHFDLRLLIQFTPSPGTRASLFKKRKAQKSPRSLGQTEDEDGRQHTTDKHLDWSSSTTLF
jgi:hypothetical protein